MNLHLLITLIQTTSVHNVRLLQYALGVGGLKSHYFRMYPPQDLGALAL